MNKILLYENDSKVGKEIKAILERKNYDVTLAQHFDSAHKLLSKDTPHIALINLNIEGNRGLQLIQQIRDDHLLTIPVAILHPQPHIPGLVDHAKNLGCFGPLEKPKIIQGLEMLLKQIHELFAQPNVAGRDRTAATLEILTHLEEKAISASLVSPGSALEFGRMELKGRTFLRIGEIVRKSRGVNGRIRNGWTTNDNKVLKDLGEELTKEIFPPLASLLYNWWKNLPQMQDDNLCLVFGGEIELIGLPLELIIYPNMNPPDYLVLKHLLVRRVVGYRPKGLRLSTHDLWGQEPLNVLLIAANTHGTIELDKEERVTLHSISKVEREIEKLDNYFRKELGQPRIGEVRTLAGPDATVHELRDALQKNITWHVVHFAGHSVNHLNNPDLSALVLRPSAWQKKPDLLRAHALKSLLDSYTPSLVYLNACEVMQVAPVVDNHIEYHGILGAFLKAGVPHILGHRWELEDKTAPDFALTFYRLLFEEQLSVELALLRARQEMWLKYSHESPIWASPVLVTQTPIGTP